MKTYRVGYGDHKGREYPEYAKFPRQSTPCGVVWVSLLVDGNRVRKYDLSQLVEVKSPFDSGMLYCYPEEAPIVYTCAEPPKPLTVVLTPEMAAHVNASALVDIVVRKPAPVISLWSEGLRVA